ncbi:spore germination protein [Gorillibacterium sp. sgz5001074]|uniref:spore germination protein n=1 Tax=Gorillibacterium sp. sgz5001074 TaxID=3446695 RepID=UPI003F67D369
MRWWTKQPKPSKSNNPNTVEALENFPDGEIGTSLDETLQYFGSVLKLASDLVVKRTVLQVEGGRTVPAAVLYIDGLADKQIVHQFILQSMAERVMPDSGMDTLEKRIVATNIKRYRSIARLLHALLYSSTLIFVDGQPEGLAVSTEGWEHRKVGETIVEPIVRGPQDAFNEVLRVNTALIRRRIKDPGLAVEGLQIGTRSLTDISILYLKHVAHPSIVKEVRRRLQAIKVDSVMEGGEIEEYLEDNPFSPFPQLMFSERVDKTVAAIMEGKVAVLVDGTPYAMSMPGTFSSFLYSPEDYYGKFMTSTFIRWIRLLALMIALFLPSVFIALVNFHQEMLPSQLMLSIAANRVGVPFPVLVEALLMETSFELLREASLRLPGNMGQTIGIVGALVIGQSAVEAGLVGPVLTIIVSFTAIGSFVIPSYNTSVTIRLLRFPIMFMAATFGIFGLVFSFAAILIHLISLRPLGVGYMEPFRPSRWENLDDSVFLKKPSFMLRFRQEYIRPLDRQRRS